MQVAQEVTIWKQIPSQAERQNDTLSADSGCQARATIHGVSGTLRVWQKDSSERAAGPTEMEWSMENPQEAGL